MLNLYLQAWLKYATPYGLHRLLIFPQQCKSTLPPPCPPPHHGKPTFHVDKYGAVFPGDVIDANVATHVVRQRRRHPNESHAVLLHASLQPANLLPKPLQPGRRSRHGAVVVASQLQLPPLGHNNVRPAGADDWLTPGWNRWKAVRKNWVLILKIP